MSDGLHQATHHEFDFTVSFTRDDRKALDRFGDAGTPEHRLRSLQSFLAALEPIADPFIAVHAEAIRKRLARLQRLLREPEPFPGADRWVSLSEDERVAHVERTRAADNLTDQDERNLQDAERLRSMIVALRNPDAQLGRKFKQGRKPGTGSPIRKAIEKLLRTRPDLGNDELWAAIAANSPRGWSLHTSARGLRLVEGPKPSKGMSWRRFCNIAAEERAKRR